MTSTSINCITAFDKFSFQDAIDDFSCQGTGRDDGFFVLNWAQVRGNSFEVMDGAEECAVTIGGILALVPDSPVCPARPIR
jgi:hypothetical protein